MNDRKDIERKIDETLNSLEGMRRAEANPFLLTRIEQRLQRSRSFFERLVVLTGRPAYALVLLCLVVVTNLTVIFTQSAATSAIAREQTQLAVADEYHLDVPALYDYENPEP